MQPSPQEYTVWRYKTGGGGRKAGIVLIVIAIFLGVISGNPGVFLAFLLILGVPGIIAFLLSKPNTYVVTNQRAMWIRSNKVIQEVQLNTPNLVITTAGGTTEIRHDRYSYKSTVHSKVNIIFVADGIELLRYRDVDAGKAEELFAKLRSMGFNVT